MADRWRFVVGLVVGALAAAVVSAGAAVAGTGIGGVLNLGRMNTVNAQTALRGTTGQRMLLITNLGSGPALGLRVQPGSAPFTVNSSTLVHGLNADQVEGRSATDFLGVDGKAADSAHADQASHADDTFKLGGIGAPLYQQRCRGGAIEGFVQVAASASFSSTYHLSGGDGTCGGGIQVRRESQGVYDVRYLNDPAPFAVGTVEEDGAGPSSTCRDDFVYINHDTDQPGTGSSTEKVFRVDVRDADGGAEDCSFVLQIFAG